jgi:hypothetical protein
MCERILALELRMKATEEALSDNVGRTLHIEEKVSRSSSVSYATVAKQKTHVAATDLAPATTSVARTTMPSVMTSHHGPRQDDKRQTHDRLERSQVAAGPRMHETGSHGNRLAQLRELSSSQVSLTSNILQPSHASQGFQYQYRRTRRKATYVTGTSRSDKFSGAPELSRDIFVYRVAKGTLE